MVWQGNFLFASKQTSILIDVPLHSPAIANTLASAYFYVTENTSWLMVLWFPLCLCQQSLFAFRLQVFNHWFILATVIQLLFTILPLNRWISDVPERLNHRLDRNLGQISSPRGDFLFFFCPFTSYLFNLNNNSDDDFVCYYATDYLSNLSWPLPFSIAFWLFLTDALELLYTVKVA